MDITRPTNFLIISLGLLCVVLGSKQVRPGDEPAPAVIDPLYNFTCKLFSNLNRGRKNNVSENIIVSPISIHMALNLVLLGTDQDTETGRELVHTLGYSGILENYHENYQVLVHKFQHLAEEAQAAIKLGRREGDSEMKYRRSRNHPPIPPVIDLFNMIIPKNKAEVLTAYKEKVEKYYNSTAENVDDERPETKTRVMDHLNSWAKEAGFDSPIMTPEELNKDFEAILLSAIRVQAFWPEKFDELEGEAIFYNHGLKDKPVNGTKLSHLAIKGARYLNLTDGNAGDLLSEQIGDLSRLNAQVVQVPLDGGLSFTIFEPLDHSTPDDNKLKKLVKQLFVRKRTALKRVLEMLAGLGGKRRKLSLTMPKFKFEKDLDLKNLLISMGLKRAFDKKRAKISRVTTTDVYISKAKHQAMIDVNNRGIKAAGVTKIHFRLESAGDRRGPIEVIINKPFVFLIRYGEIPLFVGQLSSL